MVRHTRTWIWSGADLGFSRGPLFRTWPNWISERYQNSIKTLVGQKKFCAAGTFLKKRVKKPFFGNFLEKNDKKRVFFGARHPSKLAYNGTDGAFRKILRVGQPKMDFLKNTNMGAPLGRQAFECLREEKRTLKPHHPPPPPPNPPLLMAIVMVESIICIAVKIDICDYHLCNHDKKIWEKNQQLSWTL